MTPVEKALLAIALLCALEGVVGLALPETARRLASWFTGQHRDRHRVLGSLFALAGFFLLVLILLDRPLEHWILLAFALLFAGLAFISFRQDGLDRLVDTLLTRRRPLFVRSLYAAELLVAIVVLWVALR